MDKPKEFITLAEWARRRYPDKQPHVNTLRNWARTGMIVPRPLKHGKTYYVIPEAKYFDVETLKYA